MQLYTLRDAAKIDLDRTLADIAAIGFTEVEMLMSLKNFNHSPTEVRAMLDKHGLSAPSTHVGTETLDNVDAFVDEAKILGHKYLILADVPASGRQSLATFAAFADRLNRAGEQARKHDLWIAWHDEADDFKSFGGQQGYDALVARLDPSLVRLQLDTGNAAVGGRDPLDLMKRYGDRYYSFHIKDAPSIPAEHDVELGKGVVNLAGILGAREEPGRQVLLRRAGDVSGLAAGQREAGLRVYLAAEVLMCGSEGMRGVSGSRWHTRTTSGEARLAAVPRSLPTNRLHAAPNLPRTPRTHHTRFITSAAPSPVSPTISSIMLHVRTSRGSSR